MKKHIFAALLSFTSMLTACGGDEGSGTGTQGGTQLPSGTGPAPTPSASATPALVRTSSNGTISAKIDVIATMDKPYCVAELPDGRFLVTEAYGGIRLVKSSGSIGPALTGVPSNFSYPFDVILAPDFARSRRIYFSYVEAGPDHSPDGANDGFGDGFGLAVASAILDLTKSTGGVLTGTKVIWRQDRRDQGPGEYGAKLLFSKDARYLFITSGDRSNFSTPQDDSTNIGKIVRIFPDGTVPSDNPLVGKAGAEPDIWTIGHRNPYGLAFDAAGTLWEHEHGPAGGDELNVLRPGLNYGWPFVSWGNHYDGGLIGKPTPGDGFEAPSEYWTPAIAPSGFIIYNGNRFPTLAGVGVIGGLKSKALIFVRLGLPASQELDRMDMEARIRDVRQGSNGSILVLEDSPTGRLLRLTPP